MNNIPNSYNYSACLEFVKKTWPEELEDKQKLRAESIYELSKVFFNEILPFHTKILLRPSLN